MSTKKKDLNFIIENSPKFGFQYVEGDYINSKIKLKFKCVKMGHIEFKKWNDIQQGYGCWQCSGRSHIDIEKLREIIENKNGILLSTKYINRRSKYKIQCHKGHIWESTAGHILNSKSWCPKCTSRCSKPEQEIFAMVKHIYPDAIQSKRKIFSKSPKMELDIYIPSLQKAIEFDGRYWHNLPEAKNREDRKNQYCQELNINLLRIKENDYYSNKELVFNNIREWLK